MNDQVENLKKNISGYLQGFDLSVKLSQQAPDPQEDQESASEANTEPSEGSKTTLLGHKTITFTQQEQYVRFQDIIGSKPEGDIYVELYPDTPCEVDWNGSKIRFSFYDPEMLPVTLDVHVYTMGESSEHNVLPWW